MATIVIDAGHGGADPGAVFEGRQEKDDTLRLTAKAGNNDKYSCSQIRQRGKPLFNIVLSFIFILHE